jgi:hypothetical protein
MVQQAKQISTLPSHKMLNATSQPVFLKIMPCYATPKYAIVGKGVVEYRKGKCMQRDQS